MNSVEIIRSSTGLTPELGAAIFETANAIWPPEAGAPSLDETLARWRAQNSVHFVIGDRENPVLAHALLFRREIRAPNGVLPIGALATVFVHPDYRGRGWGEAAVRAAFNFLPELGAQVSLFQTGVPHFYEKLGARTVSNRFFNGENPENPFWDSCEMIYPASFAWPDGAIDLNGPGY